MWKWYHDGHRMKKIKCSYPGCGDRRTHFENSEPRGKAVEFLVPDGTKGPWYCSIECMSYDKKRSEELCKKRK